MRRAPKNNKPVPTFFRRREREGQGMLPSLARLSLNAPPIEGRYDDASPPAQALNQLLESVVVEPVDDLQEFAGGVRMQTKNPEPGHEVRSELFGMPEFAAGTNHGGRFWLECVECIVMAEDGAKKGKFKRQITLALRSAGSLHSYSSKEFDDMLESLAPAGSGFKAPLLFKVDVRGRPTCTNNPFGTRQALLKSVVLAARQLVTNAVVEPTEPESDAD